MTKGVVSVLPGWLWVVRGASALGRCPGAAVCTSTVVLGIAMRVEVQWC